MQNEDDLLVSKTWLEAKVPHVLKQSVCHSPLKGLIQNALWIIQTHSFFLNTVIDRISLSFIDLEATQSHMDSEEPVFICVS
jgi:hypothetical protein